MAANDRFYCTCMKTKCVLKNGLLQKRSDLDLHCFQCCSKIPILLTQLEARNIVLAINRRYFSKLNNVRHAVQSPVQST